MTNKDKEYTNVVEGLKKLISEQGTQVFLKEKRVKAMIGDYFPSVNQRYKYLLGIACESGAYKMVTNRTSDDLPDLYKRAKSFLVEDYMVAEDAAAMTVNWIFEACGYKIPEEIQPKPAPVPETPKPTPVKPAPPKPAPPKPAPPKPKDTVDANVVLKDKIAMVQEMSTKLNQLSNEQLTPSQRMTLNSIRSEITAAGQVFQQLAVKYPSFQIPRSELMPAVATIEKHYAMVLALEKEVAASLPTILPYITLYFMGQQQMYMPGMNFGMYTYFGVMTYTTRACLQYNGRQYIMAQMLPTMGGCVFTIVNNQLMPEQDMNLVNYLGNFCRSKGLM